MQLRTFLTAAAATLTITAVQLAPSSMAAQTAQGRGTQEADTLLRATLTGTEQVGRGGSPNGSGLANITLRPLTNEVCYNLVIRNITGTQAHIHKAPKGENGPVAVPFTPPRDSVSSGCAKVEPPVFTDIRMNPTNYYVNVHNAEFPQGAIRGQLTRPVSSSNR